MGTFDRSIFVLATHLNSHVRNLITTNKGERMKTKVFVIFSICFLGLISSCGGEDPTTGQTQFDDTTDFPFSTEDEITPAAFSCKSGCYTTMLYWTGSSIGATCAAGMKWHHYTQFSRECYNGCGPDHCSSFEKQPYYCGSLCY